MSNLIPFNRKSGLFGDLDSFFDHDFFPSFANFTNRPLSLDTFKIDVEERENEYVVEAELAGIDKKDVALNFNEGHLTISISKTEEKNDENKNYIHRERRSSSMTRRVYLQDANSEKIIAKLDNGILKITISKVAKSATSNQIEIQ